MARKAKALVDNAELILVGIRKTAEQAGLPEEQWSSASRLKAALGHILDLSDMMRMGANRSQIVEAIMLIRSISAYWLDYGLSYGEIWLMAERLLETKALSDFTPGSIRKIGRDSEKNL